MIILKTPDEIAVMAQRVKSGGRDTKCFAESRPARHHDR